jgi:hypothetical protein
MGERDAGLAKSTRDTDLARFLGDGIAISLLNVIVRAGDLDGARGLAATLIRRKNIRSPEFLTLVSDLLSPTNKQGRGRPRAKLRKHEIEIVGAYWLFLRAWALKPSKARKLVISKFARFASDRAVNQIITDYTHNAELRASQVGMSLQQILFMGVALNLPTKEPEATQAWNWFLPQFFGRDTVEETPLLTVRPAPAP